MANLTADQARELSQTFHDLSAVLGDLRFGHWAELSAAQRAELEGEQWSLLNASSDMTTVAVAITLEDSDAAFADLQKATKKAQNTLKKLNDVRNILKVAASLVTLAAALISENPGAIVNGVKGVLQVIGDARKDEASA